MFKCQKCNSSGLRPKQIVVERKMVNHLKDGAPARGPRGGMGTQIVREVRVCETCAGTETEAPLEYNVPEKAPKFPKKIELEGFEASDAA